jgi:hypothetical protein
MSSTATQPGLSGVEAQRAWATRLEDAAKGALRGPFKREPLVIVSPFQVTVHTVERREAEAVVEQLLGRRSGQRQLDAMLTFLADYAGKKIPAVGSPAWMKLTAELTDRLG